MIQILFGSWPRRILTVAACAAAFFVSLTAAMTVAVGRAPDALPSAQKVPVLGHVAISMAARIYGPFEVALPVEQDVPTVRDMRPLSSEEVGQLIQSLKDQRQVYLQRMGEIERETKRLEMYRQELSKEREQLMALRDNVVRQWEEIKKTRSGLDRHVTELQSLESKNLKQLATSYESMKPDKAALVVKKLDEGMAAKTLYLMKERSAARIIEQLDQDTAAKLTERMALIKSVD